MAGNYWDGKLKYLQSIRPAYLNDDYLGFLVEPVWGLTEPVHIVDFGCGAGYLGLKLLPLLPDGSRYTGVDQSQVLLDAAREAFDGSPYETEFILGDIGSIDLGEGTYDLAVCHAVLVHVDDPKAILGRMVRCTKPGGRVICIEPHRDAYLGGLYVHEMDAMKVKSPTITQKLREMDRVRTGRDGNIGVRVPVYMRELGLSDVDCRMSDRVNYLHPGLPEDQHESLYLALEGESFPRPPLPDAECIARLIARGLTPEEAREQVEIERYTSTQYAEHGREFNVVAPGMLMISFGTKG